MKYFSMFTGIGGFDLAFNRNGHECIGYSEIDKYAIQIYEKKHSDKPHPYPLEEDVLVFQKIPENTCEDLSGPIDTIAFSPPFADQNQAQKHFKDHQVGCNCNYCRKNKGNAGEQQSGIEYSEDPDNIGNLKYKK